MSNNLILGIHSDAGNPIFSNYTKAIISNSQSAVYLNYREKYNELGKRSCEDFIKNYIEFNNVINIFILFNGWDFLLDLNFLSNINKKIKIINFYFDTEYAFDNHDKYYGQIADLVVLTDINCAQSYEDLLINSFTSFALYDDNLYKKFTKTNKSIDISFIGNLKIGRREEYINYLVENGVNVSVYGAASKGGAITEGKMIEIFNYSKICLNFTGLQNFKKMPPGIPKIRQRILQAKGRPIEIALCGTFVLSEFAPGLSKMFPNSASIETFCSKEELLDKINYYLKWGDYREERASLTYEYAINNYTLDKGFKKIFTKIGKSNKNLDIVYLDKIFTKEYEFQHFKQSLIFLFNLKIIFFIEELKIFIFKRPLPIIRIIYEIRRYLYNIYA